MIWKYDLITGDYWNVLPLHEQLDLLKKHYPIGKVFEFSSILKLVREDLKGVGEIIGYEKSYYVESKTKERIEIYYTIVNTNIKVEKIHPGYLIPTIDTIRDIKIDKIIN